MRHVYTRRRMPFEDTTCDILQGDFFPRLIFEYHCSSLEVEEIVSLLSAGNNYFVVLLGFIEKKDRLAYVTD
jgi:hypothetical protein